jgi:hypothetical protein
MVVGTGGGSYPSSTCSGGFDHRFLGHIPGIPDPTWQYIVHMEVSSRAEAMQEHHGKGLCVGLMQYNWRGGAPWCRLK